MIGYIIVGLNYCEFVDQFSVPFSSSRTLVLSHSLSFSLSLIFFNYYLILYRTRTSSRTRDRLRSYCFWIPRLLWEHPIGTISCKYQSYSEWGWAERDVGSLGLTNFFFAGFLRITITIRTIWISICVIGKVKDHLISHTSWKCRGRFYSLSNQLGWFRQKRVLDLPTCVFFFSGFNLLIYSFVIGRWNAQMWESELR